VEDVGNLMLWEVTFGQGSRIGALHVDRLDKLWKSRRTRLIPHRQYVSRGILVVLVPEISRLLSSDLLCYTRVKKTGNMPITRAIAQLAPAASTEKISESLSCQVKICMSNPREAESININDVGW
jgi:hypothetical protein